MGIFSMLLCSRNSMFTANIAFYGLDPTLQANLGRSFPKVSEAEMILAI